MRVVGSRFGGYAQVSRESGQDGIGPVQARNTRVHEAWVQRGSVAGRRCCWKLGQDGIEMVRVWSTSRARRLDVVSASTVPLLRKGIAGIGTGRDRSGWGEEHKQGRGTRFGLSY